ncbi:hypothetical protein [Endozoicomonas sp. OPT23]|uniref:hypothetical protein n=1 Tax=Endozoicomonas sp. OPT23 TaxID=2072845 RepID=UPI00129A8DB2|nr:hypothetical protein [Endozoicomonas sp. OPT23]
MSKIENEIGLLNFAYLCGGEEFMNITLVNQVKPVAGAEKASSEKIASEKVIETDNLYYLDSRAKMSGRTLLMLTSNWGTGEAFRFDITNFSGLSMPCSGRNLQRHADAEVPVILDVTTKMSNEREIKEFACKIFGANDLPPVHDEL